MSPEYAMKGLFSEKSDVFSFGVLILEIIIGRRNSSFYDDELALNLLGFVSHITVHFWLNIKLFFPFGYITYKYLKFDLSFHLGLVSLEGGQYFIVTRTRNIR
jgi:hypothetical protein